MLFSRGISAEHSTMNAILDIAREVEAAIQQNQRYECKKSKSQETFISKKPFEGSRPSGFSSAQKPAQNVVQHSRPVATSSRPFVRRPQAPQRPAGPSKGPSAARPAQRADQSNAPR